MLISENELLHRLVMAFFFFQLVEGPGQLFLGDQIVLCDFLIIFFEEFYLIDLFMVVVIEPGVFCGEFVMNAVDLVDFVLELESHADLLVEGLLGLFEVLY